MKKDSGFIEIIVVIIIFVLLAFYFGKDPVALWNQIKPIFELILELFLKVVGFLIQLIAKIWETVR